MKEFGLDDRQLFPLLDEQSEAMLRRLREHPHAPRYNWQTGERLTPSGLANIHAYADRVKQGPAAWQWGALPPWVMPLVRRCREKVPFYRARADFPGTEDFFSIPPTKREDIRKQPWAFVADDLPLHDLIVYTTSGTMGSVLKIPATPELPNRYLPLICHALAAQSIHLEGGQRVSIIHVCDQQPTVVLCSISSYLGGAGFAKINLNLSDWNHPDDAVAFLNDCNPELYTGDPFSLSHLKRLPLEHRPKAIVSSGVALSPALRQCLCSHFKCPVIDLYSMNETGPIGFSFTDGIHQILQPDLYVEVLNDDSEPCAPGVRGEIVVTGGMNPYLPLVRYATGDFASLQYTESESPRLINLQGRANVVFRDTSGKWFNSIDVSTALAPIPLPGFSLHQKQDGSLLLRAPDDGLDTRSILDRLRSVFGESQLVEVEVESNPTRTRKPILYSTEIAGG